MPGSDYRKLPEQISQSLPLSCLGRGVPGIFCYHEKSRTKAKFPVDFEMKSTGIYRNYKQIEGSRERGPFKKAFHAKLMLV